MHPLIVSVSCRLPNCQGTRASGSSTRVGSPLTNINCLSKQSESPASWTKCPSPLPGQLPHPDRFLTNRISPVELLIQRAWRGPVPVFEVLARQVLWAQGSPSFRKCADSLAKTGRPWHQDGRIVCPAMSRIADNPRRHPQPTVLL